MILRVFDFVTSDLPSVLTRCFLFNGTIVGGLESELTSVATRSSPVKPDSRRWSRTESADPRVAEGPTRPRPNPDRGPGPAPRGVHQGAGILRFRLPESRCSRARTAAARASCLSHFLFRVLVRAHRTTGTSNHELICRSNISAGITRDDTPSIDQ